MIPLPGATPTVAGSTEPLRASKEGSQATENNGLFGSILSSESALKEPGATADATADAGGNALPGGGNPLPALPGPDGVANPVADESSLLFTGDWPAALAEESIPAVAVPGVGTDVAKGVVSSVGTDGLTDPAAEVSPVRTVAAAAQAERLSAPGTAIPSGDVPEPVLPAGQGTGQPAAAAAQAAEVAGTGLRATPLSAGTVPAAAAGAATGQTAAVPASLPEGGDTAAIDADALSELKTPPLGRAAEGADSSARIAQLASRGDAGVEVSTVQSGAPVTRDLMELQSGRQRLVVADQVALEGQLSSASTESAAGKTPASTTPLATSLPGLAPPGQAEPTQAARPAALAPLTVPLGDPELGGELAARVNVMLKQGSQEASLQLNPPELGRLDIRIITEGDQARVQFAVHNPDAREIIEQSLPRLREMLEQGGLQLARSDVADQSQGRRNGDAPMMDLPVHAEDDADAAQFSQRERESRTVSESGVDYYV